MSFYLYAYKIYPCSTLSQLLLEAPDDILCFKFSPTDPNIIAGGCINGQVVMWDISQHTERLKAPRGGKKKAASTLVLLSLLFDCNSTNHVIIYTNFIYH